MSEKYVDGLSAIPQSGRKSFWSITMVWTGFIFVVISMMAGGGMAAGLPFKDILWVTFFGNIILSIVAILISIIAAHTGLSFALMSQFSFGKKGSRLAALFVPVINLGWYTIQSAIYGHLIALIFGVQDSIWEHILMMLSALVMGIFALLGFEALTILGFVAIPAIIFLSIGTASKAIIHAGGLQAIMAIVPKNPISFSAAVTITVGTWIFSASTCIADFMRYARNIREAVVSSALGLIVGNSLLIICGALSAYAYNDSDLPNVLLTMGLVVPSIILMTTNIWTTNGGNLFSTGINLAHTFHTSSKKATAFVLILSMILTLIKPHEIGAFFVFLNFLGTVIPPLPGIMCVDYYILNKRKYNDISMETLKDWNIIAWISWICAAVAARFIPFGYMPINGIICGGAIYFCLMKIFKVHTYTVLNDMDKGDIHER